MRLVSVDIETTGLDPTRHETWEVAIVPLEGRQGRRIDPRGYQLPVSLVGADSKALEVGGFRERYEMPPTATISMRHLPNGTGTLELLDEGLRWLHTELTDAHLLGCSVHFDAAFLAELFRRHGLGPEPWHHRYLDLGSYAAGAWGAKKPLSSKAMSDRVPNFDAHNAFSDALWNVQVYNFIRGT